MRVVKNINNNISLCLDSHNNEVVAFGKGIGFMKPPYDVPLSKIDRTFYNVSAVRLGVSLPQEEAAAIALHFVNYQTEDTGKPAIDYGALIDEATAIVEQELHVEIDKEGFNYYRFVTHMHYLMKRTEEDQMIASQNLEVFTSLRQEFPEIYQCACKIAAKMQETLHQKLSDEEILYLMLHINRLCAREDCDQ